MLRSLRNKFLRPKSRNFFWGQFSNKEFLLEIKADLVKAQEASENRLNVAQSQLKADLVTAQSQLKADLLKAQEASENRLNAAQSQLKADLIAAQKDLKADIKSDMNLQVYKIVTILTGMFISSLAIFDSIGVSIQYPWRINEVPVPNK
jgi:hypothetical protein